MTFPYRPVANTSYCVDANQPGFKSSEYFLLNIQSVLNTSVSVVLFSQNVDAKLWIF